LIASTVQLDRFGEIVRETINFDRQRSGPAVEIEYERTVWVLLSKFKTFGT
jgi:hypothetical protein